MHVPSQLYHTRPTQADAVYMSIDLRMDSKRKARREARLKEELTKYRKKRPRIQEQFRDLKTQLNGDTENQ